RKRHTRWPRDWSSDVCSSDLRCRDRRPGAVDLGPVVYHGIGAFVTAALMLKLGLPFLVSAGLAGVMAIAIAYAVGTPTLRLRGADRKSGCRERVLFTVV